MKINVTRSSMPTFEEYSNEIKDLWDSHWLTNMGAKHQKLQKELEAYFNCKHVTLFTNGHLSLENAISFFRFPRGSEIITTPFTFASTTHAIVRNGMVPVFCDIKKDDYTLDPEKIEPLITEKTVAILPVHVYGNMCDVERIDEIAKKHNLKVIYDAAHAFGVKYKGISSACYGDVSMFSFHATKVFNTIEGGCLAYNDDSMVSYYDSIKDFGIVDEETISSVGGNAKMNEFQAAMGLCNLKYVEKWIGQRKQVVDYYVKRLSNVKGIVLSPKQKDVESNYAYFPVVFDDYKYNRNEICERLKQHDISARKYFYPIVNEFDCYKHDSKLSEYKTPIAKYMGDRVLTLPLYPELAKEDIDTICDIILD